MMRITELLKAETIILDLSATTKPGVIDELVSKMDEAGRLSNQAEYKQAIWDREEQGSTGIGESVAIPHAKSSAVKTPAIVFGRSQAGIDYEALDQQPSHLFFMIAATDGANNEHLDTLARLSTMLMSEAFRKQLMEATTVEEILTLIDESETEKYGEEPKEEKATKEEPEDKSYILAITACPTGIAHTYMAADALQEQAEKMGVRMKVETRGSGGAKNVLTDEDIAQADGIIIAADTKVEKTRFDGKMLVEGGVTDGIRKPEELISTIQSGAGKTYVAEGDSDKQTETSSGQNAFYKHLMNGVSHMLPFVIGGGILIAISFLFGVESYDPDSEEFNRFAQALYFIGDGNAFKLMIPVLAGFIAMSIADRPGFAPGMVAGFMATQGDSGFIGGIIAGFLAGYIMNVIKNRLQNFPASLEGIKTILLYPLLSIFITGMIMFFVVEKPVGWFNTALGSWLSGMGSTNAVILGIVLGGMMAIDMGGPINKAAYTFGLAMIADGLFTPQAAILAGGMVPPLGIALATTVFRNKFTKEEKDAGLTNFVMGASFITEGAIPFAASDPARVIPSAVAGSAVAGGLSMLFNIGTPAPHGGIFILPTLEGNIGIFGNISLYLLALIIGMLVTATLLGVLKKKV